MNDFIPRIVLFCCNWGADAVANIDGALGSQSKSHSKIIRTMCSGRIDPSFILHALASGNDGVMVTGCHPDNCHYEIGNHIALRRTTLLKMMLPQFGIDPERLRLEWISPEEASKFQSALTEFTDKIIELGPVN